MVECRKRSCVEVLVFLAAGWASAGVLVASSVQPSIEFTGFTGFTSGNLCSANGRADLTEIDSGFTATQSDCGELTASGIGVVSAPFCENGPFGASTFTHFGVASDGGRAYSLAPGTPVTEETRSYGGPNGSGAVKFVSRITFACDTGKVLSAVSYQPAGTCQSSDTSLCLGDGRFRVSAHFDAGHGNAGTAHVVQLTPDTGYLWFFASSNVEVAIKVLNGCALGGHYWVFAGGLTNVNVVMTVTDTKSGKSNTYTNPQGKAFQPIQDTSAFATCSTAAAATPEAAAPRVEEEVQAMNELVHAPAAQPWIGSQEGQTGAATCAPSSSALCLNGGRFRVSARFDAGGGSSGAAQVVQLTPDTGYLWFFGSSNVEAVVKVLNGCGLGGHYWVFAGGLTNVKVVTTVTDTLKQVTRTYTNPANTKFQPIQDTSAFATCP